MARAYLYLTLAGIVWLIEAFLFSHYLGFAWWQTSLLVAVYALLFSVATRRLIQALGSPGDSPGHVAAWRLVTVAPMLVVIVGSFASLPVLILVAALGKL